MRATTVGTPVQADSPWVRALDAATDAALVAFAAWTLVYEIALAGEWSLWWPGRVWLVGTVAGIAFWCARAARRPSLAAATVEEPPRAADPDSRIRWRTHDRLGLSAALLLAALAVWFRDTVGLLPLTLVVIGLLVWLLLRDRRRTLAATGARSSLTPTRSSISHPTWMHAAVVLSCMALAVLASLLVKPDADDAYYVNRATWIAQHGVPVTSDTMFSPGTLPSTYGGGLPLASVEALQGAVAHALGLQAPTLAYLVFAPVMALAFGWVTWRLVRLWAPRRALVVHVVALAFVLWSAQTVIGNYSVGRIWQGKVVAFAIVMPLVWHAFSKVLDGARRGMLLYLLLCGVALVGLTSTAVLLAPVLAGAAFLAAIVRRSAALAQGAGLFLVPPLIAGLVVALGPGQVGGADPVALPVHDAFTMFFGSATLLVLLAVAALILGPRTVAMPHSTLLACGSLTVFAALLPGVFTLVNAATGAGPVAWRLLLGSPVWVLVGLLAAAPTPAAWGRLLERRAPDLRSAAGTVVGAVVAGAIGLVLATSGTLLWSSEVGARLDSTPSWKVNGRALDDVRSAEAKDVPSGTWLLPQEEMQVMAISDTRHFAVVPRDLYLTGLTTGSRDLHDRLVLLDLVRGGRVNREDVRVALRRLDVSLACVPAGDARARRTLAGAVGARLRPVGHMRCHANTA